MELVKGTPITEFCDEQQLSPRQRLELFVPVCQAIQHAHQKGIIHRDIKPSNVLVALYDDRPVPKVIDFGVAKATGQTLTEQTLFTGFGGMVGTPEYMSPGAGRAQQPGHRHPQRRLLAGRAAVRAADRHDAGGPQGAGQGGARWRCLRIVREDEPPRPSTELSAPPTPAERRGQPRHGAGEADAAAARRARLDRDEGAGEGPHAALRDGQRPGRDIQRYLADEPVRGPPAERGVSAAEVRPAAQGGRSIAAAWCCWHCWPASPARRGGLVRAERTRQGRNATGRRRTIGENRRQYAAAVRKKAKERRRYAARAETAAEEQAEGTRADREGDRRSTSGYFFIWTRSRRRKKVLRCACRWATRHGGEQLEGEAVGDPVVVAASDAGSPHSCWNTDRAETGADKGAADLGAISGANDPTPSKPRTTSPW